VHLLCLIGFESSGFLNFQFAILWGLFLVFAPAALAQEILFREFAIDHVNLLFTRDSVGYPVIRKSSSKERPGGCRG
jgi:hypothetical protein